MKFGQPFLCVAPKTLQTVDVDFSGGKAFPMIDPQMPVATKHQRVVTSKLVGIDDRAAADGLDGHIHQTLGRDVSNHFDLHNAVSLEDSEDRNLPGRPATAFSLAAASEIGLIQFNLARQEQLPIHMSQGGPSKQGDGLQDRWIAQSDLLSNPAGRQFDLKELDDPQPAFIRNSQPVDPPTRKVMERITTPLTAVSSAQEAVVFPASAPCTKNTPIFCTRFSKEQSRSIFRFTDELKGFQFH